MRLDGRADSLRRRCDKRATCLRHRCDRRAPMTGPRPLYDVAATGTRRFCDVSATGAGVLRRCFDGRATCLRLLHLINAKKLHPYRKMAESGGTRRLDLSLSFAEL